jgi:hypothetical protein
MTCREFIESLADHLAGTLTARLRAACFWHERSCAHCLPYANSYRDTIRSSKTAFASSIDSSSTDLSETLLAAVLNIVVNQPGWTPTAQV